MPEVSESARSSREKCCCAARRLQTTWSWTPNTVAFPAPPRLTGRTGGDVLLRVVNEEAIRRELSELSTERIADDLADVDTWPTIDMVREMNRRDADVPAAVGRASHR